MSVRSAALWSLGSQYFGFAVQFVVSVLISRFFLLPAEVGLFSIGLAAALMVATLQDFGLTRYIAGRPEMTREETRVCSSVSALFSLVIAGAVAGLAWPMAQFYSEPGLTRLMLVIAASYLLVPFSVVPFALATRAMDFRAVFAINATGALVGGATSLALAAYGLSAESLAWGVVAQAVARAMVAQWTHPAPVPLVPRLAKAGEVFRFGSLNSVLFVSGAIGSRSADLVVGAAAVPDGGRPVQPGDRAVGPAEDAGVGRDQRRVSTPPSRGCGTRARRWVRPMRESSPATPSSPGPPWRGWRWRRSRWSWGSTVTSGAGSPRCWSGSRWRR